MAENIVCPICESEELDKNYNYDTAHTDYECKECGHTFTEDSLIFCDQCGKQVIGNPIWSEGMTFCSMDCCNTFEIQNEF